MASQTEVLLLRVDIQANNERLVFLQKQLNDTKTANAALNQSFKEGKVTGDELAAGQVRLKQTAADINQETRILTKVNRDQEAATKASTGSIEQLRAQLASGTAAYNALSAAERDNTDAGQKLQATNRATSDQLKVLEGAIGDTRRNVGNYAGSIGPLIQELVKLQEQQKKIPEGTAAYQQAQAKVIGFQQAVNDAGVKAGLTYEQTQAKIAGYGTAIQPVTAKLVALENEQKKVGEGSKEYAKIGFQIGAVKKELEKIPEQARKVGDSLKTGLQQATDKGLSPFKAQLEQGTGLLGKFKSGSDLVKQGLGLLKGAGETGSLGFKAVAGGIALTGIGLFVLAISAVVSYFTQTAEGGKALAAVLGGLGAVLQVATDVVSSLGKGLVQAATSPKQAFADLVAFLEGQVLNRLRSFSVILAGIKTGNLREVTNGFLQLNTGVVDVLGKVDAFGRRIGTAAAAGAALVLEQKALVKARRELEIEDVKEQSRVNVLLRLSKERGKSATEQVAALQEAGRIEAALTEKNVALQRRELAAIQEGIRLKGAGKAADLLAEKGQKQKEIAQTLATQDEVNAKIRVRESVFREKLKADAAAEVKAAREARLEAARDVVRGRQTALELQLLQATKDSAAELVLKKKQVEAARDLELIAEKQTRDQKALIRAKAQTALRALDEEFLAQQVEAAKKASEQEANVVAARLTEANREYAEALTLLENHLNNKRAALERDYAAGKLSENQYQRQLNAIEKAGLDAQSVLNGDYRKDNAKANKAAADLEIKEQNRVKNEKRKIEDTKQAIIEASLQAGIAASDAVVLALGEETAAGQAALAIKKVLSLAEIGINLEKQLSLNATTAKEITAAIPPPLGIALGIAYEVAADALTIASGAASAAKILAFNTGGVVPGTGDPRRDTVPAWLAPGEVIINPARPETLPPLLSYLSQASGVKIATFNTGGIVGAQAPRSFDGGLAARAAGNAAPALDYATLIKAIADYGRFDVGVTTLRRAEGRYDRVRGLSQLGG